MLPAAAFHVLLPAIVGLSVVLMLIRPRGIQEVYWIGGGVLLLLALGLVPVRLAGRAVGEGLDVYLFLAGMMMLSELAREQGVFDWLSSAAIRGAHGSCARLFTLVYALGTVVTVLLSNDATAVVLTPAILAAVRKAKVTPLPYLFACALIANAASFVLPISNPANLVVFRLGMPPLGRWLALFGVPSILSIAATYMVMRVVFRKELADNLADSPADSIDDPVEAKLTANGRLVVAGLALTVVILLIASAMNRDLGLPTCVAAVAITAVISIKTRTNPMNLARQISWATIALVAGLFILVDAVESAGTLHFTAAALAWAGRLGAARGALITGFAVGVANNVVNNLPLGLIAAGTLKAAHAAELTASAVLIGVDLGPNLSVSGSLATILWLIALRREKLHVSYWTFLRVGAIAMPIALFAALCGAVLMRFVTG
ncbi:MAG TPA: SLC13 family permease [Terracidiphilus sp.]|jgi:arsenical pump membrane protein|nr:SLC13 family permease [Terracidiphilus sp.]